MARLFMILGLACLLVAVNCQSRRRNRHPQPTPAPPTTTTTSRSTNTTTTAETPYTGPECTPNNDNATFPVRGVCYAYFVCQGGLPIYQTCDEFQSFDEVTGKCVDDQSCFSACPPWVNPIPDDDTGFLLGQDLETATIIPCVDGYYFEIRVCACIPRPE